MTPKSSSDISPLLGPWTTRIRQVPGISEDRNEIGYLYDEDGAEIANCYGGGQGNFALRARLERIKMVPEMIEALQVAQRCLETIDWDVLSRSDRREIEKSLAYISDALEMRKPDSKIEVPNEDASIPAGLAGEPADAPAGEGTHPAQLGESAFGGAG